jgi:hypothetical protein
MAVNLSALAGAGQQFFDNNGNPLSGGKLYSYEAGTTTPQATYTTAVGNVAHTNPIVLDSAGRVPSGQIWLDSGLNYKFVLYTSVNALIASYDNITGINGTGITSNASNVNYDPAGTGAVQTTVQDKLRQTVSIKDFGAIENVNCAQSIIDAANATDGIIEFPEGNFVATATTANSSFILGILNRVTVSESLIITLSSGEHNFTNEIKINSSDAQRIQILGAATVLTSATSQVSVSGSAKNYAVTIGVASNVGIVSGDYALIRQNVAGTGDFYSHAGVWKVVSVGTGTITVLNTNHQASFPTNTLTGGSIAILKTICKFTGCDGFRFEGGQPLGLLNRIAIVGDYDVSLASGTEGAHGIVMSTPNIIVNPATSSNDPYNTFGGVEIGESVGVSAFGEQGVVGGARTALVGNFMASCSNRKRGIYVEGGSFRIKFAVASGNGEDGFISDLTGSLQTALCIASGNGNSGFLNINNSVIAAAFAVASSNVFQGFDSRNFGLISADSAIAYRNTLNGFSAQSGANIQCGSSSANENGSSGYSASGFSSIHARNSSAINNIAYGASASSNSFVNIFGTGTVSGNVIDNYRSILNSYLIETTNDITPSDFTTGTQTLYEPDRLYYVQQIVSNIGDLILTFDGVTRLFLKNDGSITPATNEAQVLGSVINRWLALHTKELFVGPSSAKWTSNSGTPEGNVSGVVGSLYTRTDGGAGTTLYVKESGTGQTGWVAK